VISHHDQTSQSKEATTNERMDGTGIQQRALWFLLLVITCFWCRASVPSCLLAFLPSCRRSLNRQLSKEHHTPDRDVICHHAAVLGAPAKYTESPVGDSARLCRPTDTSLSRSRGSLECQEDAAVRPFLYDTFLGKHQPFRRARLDAQALVHLEPDGFDGRNEWTLWWIHAQGDHDVVAE
jgi:hypothetical protein